MSHTPSFSRPTGGGSHPQFSGGGNRPNIGGGGAGTNRPNFSGGNRPNSGTGFGPGNRPEIGSGNRGNFASGIDSGNRGNIGSGNIGSGNRGNTNIGSGNRNNIGNNTNLGNRTNINNFGNRTNIGNQVGRNNFNHIGNTNINIAANHSYNNNWNHGNWSGNWNRPLGAGGAGYWHAGNAWGGYWWHGGGGFGYWGGAWYTRPLVWGLGAWAIGSAFYNSGYANYSNPYYAPVASNAGTCYDYSQPIPVVNNNLDATATNSTTDQPAALPPEVQEGTSHGDLARDAFKNGDYAGALRETDAALKSLPKDAALHEFRALVLFATKDYKQAAATLYAVLSAGPGWDWTTLSSMYANVATYADQLRILEQYVTDNPNSADGHFVLAYHYLTCGHTDSAENQLREVIKLQPQDQLSPQLLKMMGGTPTSTGGSPVPQPPDAEDGPAPGDEPAAPPSIDATKIVGKWNAKRPDGSTFMLNLTSDAKFTWTFEKSGKKQEFGGRYSVDGAILVLERADGAQMPGLITMSQNGFNFKLYGGPADDKGLDFGK